MQALLGHKKTPIWIWLAALAFVGINAVFIAYEIYYLPLVPVVLLFVLVAVTRLDVLLLTIVFFAPLSLQLSYLVEGVGVDLYLPTEPLLAMLLLVYVLRYFLGYRADIKILRHPVTIAVYFYLAWMFITIFTSSNPIISIKYFVSKLWFVVGFYLLAIEVFRKQENIKKYAWLYVISFSLVILYTLIRHSGYGLDNQMMAHSMMQPFFNDHTSYGATLAFLIPVLIALFAIIKKGNMNSRFLIGLLLVLFLAATLFSYTRAAWVSLLGGLAVWAAIKLRIKFEILALAGIGLIVLFFVFQPMIMLRLEDNRTKSSGDLAEHVQSISNISNDQSNLERINRWSCALRMWKEQPIFGFGPGTYQFEYGRFQRSYEKTEISTDFGTRGTAHSEYFGPLSESGIFGMLRILIIIGLTILTGIRVILNAKSRSIRILSLGILIGLITYYIHGVLNNFLDTDKASALFWGYTAMLVAMDVYHKDTEEEKSIPEI
jgi:putative inorganic carbon (HCO3(-)) transporter